MLGVRSSIRAGEFAAFAARIRAVWADKETDHERNIFHRHLTMLGQNRQRYQKAPPPLPLERVANPAPADTTPSG